MDSNSEEDDYHNPMHAYRYKENYSVGKITKVVDYNKEELKKRCPGGRSGSNPGRVKRVVSCKRKTHHLTVAWKKQSVCGKTYDMANKENEMNCAQDMQQEIFSMDPWEFPSDVNNQKTGGTSSKHTDYFTLTELSMDHRTVMNVLFGRNLRLKVALSLWERNVGELLTYFLRIQDTGVFVDFLPVITKSINEDSPSLSIGCCVDLFPMVKKVLNNPYEEYLIVGLKWINSVLKNWWKEFRASGHSGLTDHPLDKNFQVFNQLLLELWRQEPYLKSVPGIAGDLAKDIECYLFQLT
ncbi:KATNB1-like protein 1 isoform X2 [Lampris incognitus]|nr:KATNB1-like protein 1 isoform X2 [Lampris incognitus]